MIKYVLRFIPLLISTVIAVVSMFPASIELLEKDIVAQTQRVAELEEAYANGEIMPVDETVFFDGNLESELENGLKFNELRYIATHNSYQTKSTEEMKKIYSNLSELTFGLIGSGTADFVSPTITEQLNSGIYSMELDVETFDRNGEISFTCMHSPYLEMGTSCYDFELALKEISMWSDNNPGHLPVTFIVEMKEIFIPLENMEWPNIGYVEEFDRVLRENLGDKLFTPADMLRDYENFAALRADDGWCEVEDMRGKVLFLLHKCGLTDDYIDTDDSLRTQAMFPMMKYNDTDNKNASFLIMNNPKSQNKRIREATDENFIVRTRADKYNGINEENRRLAFESGAQMISTDYPVKHGLEADDYYVSFGGMKTISITK